MKTIIFLLLLASSGLQAQNPSSPLDLSGEWRRSTDDRPEYVGTAVDESGWETVRLPWSERPPLGRYWLRRTIGMPPQFQNQTLFLTLGPIAEAYEIYLNGQRAGGTDESPNDEPSQRARSRFFRLPTGLSADRLTIAIRVHRPSAPPSLIYYAGGSYLLTPKSPDLADENQILVFRQQRRFVSNLVIGYVLLSFAVLLWLLWMSERRRLELLWLGLLSASRGAYSLSAYFAIAGDPAFLNPISSSLDALTGAALAELVLSLTSSLQKRWLRAFFWCGWALYVLLSLPTLATTRWLGGLTLALIAFGWLREKRRGLDPDPLMWIFLTLVALAFLNTGFGVVPLGFEIYGYEYSLRSFAITILSVLIASGSLRRLIADRRQKQRLESEFEAASAVQRLMLTASAMHEPGLTFDAVYKPAMEVGGDFYYVLEGGQVVVVGDVSGKGLKAAMLVSLLIGVMRETSERRPGALLAALNRAIAGRTDGGFVTCCCVRVDPGGLVTIANAGHLPPYLDGTEASIETSLPLGLSLDLDWPETELHMPPDSRLTLVSDGVVEAANAAGELFGFERTREISTKSAAEIAEAARAWGQNDDITVVTLRRRSSNS